MKEKKIERIYHHYEKWEDYKNGMYNEKKDSEKMFRINESILLLQQPEILCKAMRYVAKKWRHSAEVNLTNTSCNRRAWLGQSACNMDIGAVESEVREAWGCLTEQERIIANNIADKVIGEWEEEHIKSLS